MHFTILSSITGIENIAVGGGIRDLARLEKAYGKGRWRKVKGFAIVELEDGTVTDAEIHWYEAHGIGAFEHKIKSED